MPDDKNTQYALTRVRPPRVKITYDVEIGDAVEKKQLPLVAGIMADLGGNKPVNAPVAFKSRKFVEIDRDNFDAVMQSITPGLEFSVDNRLTPQADDKLPVKLKFVKMEDFDPAMLVLQVPELKALFRARQRLSDLATKLDGNDELEGELRNVVKLDEAKLQQIKALTPPPPEDKLADDKPADDTPADDTPAAS